MMLPPGAREPCEMRTRTEVGVGREGMGRSDERDRTADGAPALLCVQASIVSGRGRGWSSSANVEDDADGTGLVDLAFSGPGIRLSGPFSDGIVMRLLPKL
jgi:hypothetical protein